MVTQKGKYVCAWLSWIGVSFCFLHLVCFLEMNEDLVIWILWKSIGWNRWSAFARKLRGYGVNAIVIIIIFIEGSFAVNFVTHFRFWGLYRNWLCVLLFLSLQTCCLHIFIDKRSKLIWLYVIRFNRASRFWIRAIVSQITIFSIHAYIYISSLFGY